MIIGVGAVTISTIFATAKDLLSKKLAGQMNGNVSAGTSFLFALPWYLVLLLLAEILGFSPFEYQGQFLLYVCIRAITDSFAELFKMHALGQGEISFIANFFSLTPLFLIFLAPIITGDHISNMGLIGLGIIVLGTLFLLKAPSNTIPWKGVFYAVVSAFFMSLNICFDRLAVKQANPIFSGFMMTLLSSFILTWPMLRVKTWKSEIKNSYKLLSIRGLYEVLFMSLKLVGLKFLEPQYASGIQKMTLVLSVAIGGRKFNEKDQAKRIFTSLLILLGSLIIVYSKIMES